jgi:predicted ATP-dependent endonuclease of OLD family
VHLNAIRIENFRRLKTAGIDFEKDLTIFVGSNNSGKTSATHAFYFFLSGPQVRFSFHDLSANCWEAFRQIETSGEADQRAFPKITLDLWLSDEEADLHRVIDLLPSLD